MSAAATLLGRTVRSGYLRGLVAQGTASAANFLCVVLLARYASSEDLGQYTVFFAAMMIAIGINGALIVTPMRILGVGRDETYFKGQLQLQALLVVPTMAVFAVAIAWFSGLDALAIGVSSLALGAIVVYTFVRFAAFARSRSGTAVVFDVVCHGGRYVLIALALAAGLWGGIAAIAAFGIGATIAVLLAWRGFATQGPQRLGALARENWRHGRWVLVDAIAHSLSNQAYVLFIAYFLGSGAAGIFGSGQNLLNVVNMLLAGFMAHGVSGARRALNDTGYSAWYASIRRMSMIAAGMIVPYLVLVGLFAEPLLRAIYGEEYTSMAPNMAMFATVYALIVVNMLFGAAYRTSNQFQIGVAAKLASLVATLTVGVWLVLELQLRGVVLGMLATQLVLFFVYLGYALRGHLGRVQVAASLARG
jgi:O-antigen/teichoic acid export membrane protein